MNPADRSAAGGARAGPLDGGLRLGRWAGVPIATHWSTVATLALFTWLLAAGVLPSAAPGHSHAAYWAVGVLTAAVFLVTLLAHELAHAVVARHYGMRVKKITLWMLGGLTELDGNPPAPRADAWIAAAGPLVSVGIGLLGGAVYWATGVGGLVGAALLWVAEVSVVLGVFNLLPGAPLDGGRLLRALLWRRYGDRGRAGVAAARAGRVLGTVLVGLGFVEVIYGGLAGLWLALIGWFILGASAAERSVAGLERLRGVTVAEIMSPAPLIAPDWWTVARLLDELWQHRAEEVIPVVDFAGQLTGVITLRGLSRVRPAERDATRLRDVSAAALTLPADAPVADCLPALQRGATVVVTDAGRPTGVVSASELSRALLLAALRDHAPDDDLRRPSAA